MTIFIFECCCWKNDSQCVTTVAVARVSGANEKKIMQNNQRRRGLNIIHSKCWCPIDGSVVGCCCCCWGPAVGQRQRRPGRNGRPGNCASLCVIIIIMMMSLSWRVEIESQSHTVTWRNSRLCRYWRDYGEGTSASRRFLWRQTVGRFSPWRHRPGASGRSSTSESPPFPSNW